MPGPAPKPAAKRQRRNQRDVGAISVVPTAVASDHPEPQKGLLKAVEQTWFEFWTSETSGLVKPADLPALHRLWSLYDERQRCLNSARKGRVVEGSTGQPVLNPLYKHMATLDSQIVALEDRFGLTPMARLKLGVTFGEAHRSLADLNASVEADDDADDEDPRFTVVDADVVES